MEKEASSVKQEQIHDILFSREIGWQEIIYDLINTEQLDPWDININVLAEKYLARIEKLEEADFFISSKVLFAAALLLRIKSEIILNKYIRSIDDILFGRKDKDEPRALERIDLDETIPELMPRSPVPRFRRVTLQELISSLNKAIITENRRIKKEITNKNALFESSFSLPKRKGSITEKIREIYDKIIAHLAEDDKRHKVSFTDFVGDNKEERLVTFSPLLHLENQKKIWLEQEKPFDEFHIWIKETYLKYNPDPFADLRKELEAGISQLTDEEAERMEKVQEDFENPLGEMAEDKQD